VPSAKQTQGRVFKAPMNKVPFIYDMTDDDQLKMVADILRKNRNIQKIELDCQRTQETLFILPGRTITANGLDYFSASLRSLHGLKSINLKLGE